MRKQKFANEKINFWKSKQTQFYLGSVTQILKWLVLCNNQYNTNKIKVFSSYDERIENISC